MFNSINQSIKRVKKAKKEAKIVLCIYHVNAMLVFGGGVQNTGGKIVVYEALNPVF